MQNMSRPIVLYKMCKCVETKELILSQYIKR
jgi:hypothetical protein